MWVRMTMGSRRELFKSNYFIHVVGNINSINHFIFIIFNYHYMGTHDDGVEEGAV